MIVDHPFRPNATHPQLCNGAGLVACLRPESEHAAPGWETAPAPPAWVLEHLSAGGWRNAGERRWHGSLDGVHLSDLLVLVNTAGTGFMRHVLCLADYGPDDEFIRDWVFDELQAGLDHEALPGCVAPGCTAKGVCRMVAAELGHLAGRVYAAGDEIRMCHPHALDVYRAGDGLDSIAEWLRPDAEVRDPYALIASAYDQLTPEDSRRKYARLPRLMHPEEGTTR